ncbi:MAG: NAD(P)/FAD-dependent oxidoreductase [Bacteroidota bacterium]
MNSSNTESHTIVISGAGPAGTMAAAFLSREGIPHLLIDKAVFPRDKICGDALSGKVFTVLKKLDPNIRSKMGTMESDFLPCEGIVFIAPNGKSLDVPFKSKSANSVDGPAGFVSPRSKFDHYLHNYINKEHTDFRQATELMAIERGSEVLTLTLSANGKPYQVKTKLLIAADGERSLAAKFLGGIKKEADHFSAGIRVYYEGVTDMHPKNYIELHFIKEFLPGYLWIFPLPNGKANIGAGVLSKHASKQKMNLRQMLTDCISTHPAIKDRFKNATPMEKVQGWGLPLGSKKRKLSGDNFILSGDAASLIDPFTGEGISNAMFSGMMAAETAIEALKMNDYSDAFLQSYDSKVYRRLGGELKLSRTMQKLCNYPFLFNLVVNKAERNREFRETISCMFDDLDLRAKLKKPGFYFNLIFGGK